MNHFFVNRPVLILLDRDARYDAHEIRKKLVSSRLGSSMQGQVVIGSLPEGYNDPGECPQEILFDSLRRSSSLPDINLLPALPYAVAAGFPMQLSSPDSDRRSKHVAISYLSAYDPDADAAATSDLILVDQDHRPCYVIGATHDFHRSLEERTPVYHDALVAHRIEIQQGFPLPVQFEDLSVAARLLDENAPFDLQKLTKRFLPEVDSPGIVSNPANPEIAKAMHETTLIYRLWDQGQIAQQLKQQELEFLYREVELPVLAPVAAMMENGVLFDASKLGDYPEKYASLVKNIEKQTNVATGRVHCQLNSVRSRTGRIYSTEPNWQGLPAELRHAVVAEEGHVLVAADLSQFEWRILAHFTQEPQFLRVYESGVGDFHQITAADLCAKSLAEITEEERQIGKMINFSILNGQTSKGLAGKLDATPDDALLFIEDFHQRYPEVSMWIDRSIQRGREQGYVTSLYGRRRHLPDLNSNNPIQRDHAERQVVSGIIQATGADLFKWILVQLAKRLPPEFKMVLPIHDEILFEIPTDRVEDATWKIREIMQAPPPQFTVPLVVNIKVGESWGGMKAWTR